MEVNERRVMAPLGNDARRFRYSLGAALLVHAMLFVSFNSARPRQLGDPSGTDDALSVEIVTDADLGSRATVASSGGGPIMPLLDGEPTPQPADSPSALRPTQPEATTSAEPTPNQPASSQVPSAAAKSAQPKSAPQDLLPLSLAEAVAQLELKPDRHSGPSGKTPSQDAKTADGSRPAPTQTKPAANSTIAMKLDLSLPQSAFMRQPFTGGRGGVERPPGYTRSGENDDFARGVVRALQYTMPQLRDTVGRVTVRITLDARGNLANTQVVNSSGSASLDQSVVFATKQTNFPIPPRNHVSQDLIFLVTYVYR